MSCYYIFWWIRLVFLRTWRLWWQVKYSPFSYWHQVSTILFYDIWVSVNFPCDAAYQHSHWQVSGDCQLYQYQFPTPSTKPDEFWQVLVDSVQPITRRKSSWISGSELCIFLLWSLIFYLLRYFHTKPWALWGLKQSLICFFFKLINSSYPKIGSMNTNVVLLSIRAWNHLFTFQQIYWKGLCIMAFWFLFIMKLRR